MSEDRKEPSLFALVPAKVRYDTRLSLRARLLFGELNAMAYSNGYCYATDAYFARLYNVNRTTISADINDLKRCGYINVEVGANSHGTERRIYVLGPSVFSPSPEAGGVVGNNRQPPEEGSRNKQTGGCRDLPTGGSPENQTTGSRKFQTQKNINNKNNITPISPELLGMLRDFAGEDGRLLKALMDMAELRAKIKKPFRTAQQITLFLNKLKRLSGGERRLMYQLLDEAIERGWQTVYPLKDGDSQTVPVSGRIEESEEVEEWRPKAR